MADRREYISSLRRSKQRLLTWIDSVPEDAKLDFRICVNEFCDEAEREIETAYWDGFKQHRLQTQIPRASVPTQQRDGSAADTSPERGGEG